MSGLLTPTPSTVSSHQLLIRAYISDRNSRDDIVATVRNMMKSSVTDDGAQLDPLRPLADQDAQTLVRYFKLFADETRVRILHYLAQRRELNVQSICELLGQTQPAVSHHLAILRAHALIEMRRQGKHNFYHVRAERFDDIRDLLSLIEPPIS